MLSMSIITSSSYHHHHNLHHNNVSVWVHPKTCLAMPHLARFRGEATPKWCLPRSKVHPSLWEFFVVNVAGQSSCHRQRPHYHAWNAVMMSRILSEHNTGLLLQGFSLFLTLVTLQQRKPQNKKTRYTNIKSRNSDSTLYRRRGPCAYLKTPR